MPYHSAEAMETFHPQRTLELRFQAGVGSTPCPSHANSFASASSFGLPWPPARQRSSAPGMWSASQREFTCMNGLWSRAAIIRVGTLMSSTANPNRGRGQVGRRSSRRVLGVAPRRQPMTSMARVVGSAELAPDSFPGEVAEAVTVVHSRKWIPSQIRAGKAPFSMADRLE